MILIRPVFLFFIASVLMPVFLFAQDEDIALIKKYADNAFRDQDYEFALENFLELYKNDKENIDLNYKIGICYTETNIDKVKAIPFLEWVVSHNNYPIKSFYYLGRAYMYDYRFTEAVEAFYEYKMIGTDLITETDRLIEMCYYALEKINYPVNVTFSRIDTSINTKYDEYYPFVVSDQSTLFFSSNRTYVKEYEAYISSSFYSESKKGVWQSGLRLPTSTFDNEEIVGCTPMGDKILIYANGDYSTHDIKLVNRKGSKFTKGLPGELPADMNTEGIEMGACISADGNTIYYASNKRGGAGGLDIYFAKKGADGKWGPSENIGRNINTEFDENFPTLSADGKKLYFASKGHECFGGYDIFFSIFLDDSKTWSSPLNLGFPINTPLDNTTISFTPDGTNAYMAIKRNEGMGNLDIYKLTYGDNNQQPITYAGTVLVGNETNSVPYSEDFLKATATFYDQYNNLVARLDISADNQGVFFAVIYPGSYLLEVKFEGQESGYREQLTFNQSDAGSIISKTIYLKPPK